MIPLEFMQPTGGDPIFESSTRAADDLLHGRSRGLDVIIDGILDGSPFVYPADDVGVHS
jgi:hypothetical protein